MAREEPRRLRVRDVRGRLHEELGGAGRYPGPVRDVERVGEGVDVAAAFVAVPPDRKAHVADLARQRSRSNVMRAQSLGPVRRKMRIQSL